MYLKFDIARLAVGLSSHQVSRAKHILQYKMLQLYKTTVDISQSLNLGHI